jgi:hypothetical protein
MIILWRLFYEHTLERENVVLEKRHSASNLRKTNGVTFCIVLHSVSINVQNHDNYYISVELFFLF